MQYTNQGNAINKFNRRFSVAPSTSPKLEQSNCMDRVVVVRHNYTLVGIHTIYTVHTGDV